MIDIIFVASDLSATVDEKRNTLPVSGAFQFAAADLLCASVNQPSRFNAEIASCVVHGNIPQCIDGTFYRIICDFVSANRDVHDIWIGGGERAARKPLWGTYWNSDAGDPRVFNQIQSTGNTHVQWWQQKLLVLKEDSPPLLMDPDTLDTIGNSPAALFSLSEVLGFGMGASGLGMPPHEFDLKHMKEAKRDSFSTELFPLFPPPNFPNSSRRTTLPIAAPLVAKFVRFKIDPTAETTDMEPPTIINDGGGPDGLLQQLLHHQAI
ncbi:lignostilbene dioxygenase [Colletotrichum kahawae]|uniref:Lignostilbene dioxygenase n=1 Tax=Colletotrichum kahawae TaxID=34407 RepID=A0AAD9Y3V4_COLKA|nr:lignostilbene dioxygenase [Colletotrichum kahawae]